MSEDEQFEIGDDLLALGREIRQSDVEQAKHINGIIHHYIGLSSGNRRKVISIFRTTVK